MEWIKKRKYNTEYAQDADVVLTNSLGTKGKCDTTYINFKNTSWAKITTTGYIVIGIEGSRLYFAEAPHNEGFKLSTFSADKSGCRVGILAEKLPTSKLELGSYKLKYDIVEKLYFIDALEKMGN